MKKILIIGATSSIAEHCARLWADRKDALFLVGRNAERLTTIAKDLKVRGASQIEEFCLDLNLMDQHQSIIEKAEQKLGGIDVVLIAHGTLSDQGLCEESVQETLREIHTNALSTVSLLTLVANYFDKKQSGTLAVISSVAGDRGRASNYVYGSSKAMITSFTSGLRQRLFKSNVSVVTIKPGFVDTPMTASFKKGPLWAKPCSVAKSIVTAIDKGKDTVYVPTFWRFVMFAITRIPDRVFKRIWL